MHSDTENTFLKRAKFCQVVVNITYPLLLASILMTYPWFVVVPLALPAWGIYRKTWRSYIWLCFILMFYFLLAINDLATGPGLIHWVHLVFISLLFFSGMMYCRWAAKGNPAPPENPEP
jgi:uncharacterized membrane protein